MSAEALRLAREAVDTSRSMREADLAGKGQVSESEVQQIDVDVGVDGDTNTGLHPWVQ